MDKLEATFALEKDTRRTRRYSEEMSDRPPVIGTIYIQQWALKQLAGGNLPDRVRVTVEVVE